MANYYLINAELVQEGVKLILFNSANSTWKEVVDKNYRSYFFLSHPIPSKEQETLEELGSTVKIETKEHLFTGQSITVTKVEYEASAYPKGFRSGLNNRGKATSPPC